MKKLLPLILLFIGAGAGVGAGIFLRPDPPPEVVEEAGEGEDVAEGEDHAVDDAHEDENHAEEEDEDGEAPTTAFAKMSNQFVIPIVANEKVASLVVLSLNLEVAAGEEEGVYSREPKLRDSFLQVLFDHANMGAFNGNFTDAKILSRLRRSLLEVAQKDMGKKIIKDVLIIEIARQDY